MARFTASYTLVSLVTDLRAVWMLRYHSRPAFWFLMGFFFITNTASYPSDRLAKNGYCCRDSALCGNGRRASSDMVKFRRHDPSHAAHQSFLGMGTNVLRRSTTSEAGDFKSSEKALEKVAGDGPTKY